MGDKSAIEWTEATWNPVTGCTKVSPGCKHCYAETMAKRLQAMGQRNYRNGFELTLQPHMLDQPNRWRRPRMIFVNSMSDLFHEEVPMEYVARVFTAMQLAPRHTFQVLTKRSGRMSRLLGPQFWTPNIWAGVSVESQEYLSRVDDLRASHAHVRFLSCEPLLGPLSGMNLEGIDWVIAGGESGKGHRPMKAEWVRGIRDQCLAASVPFFFKQWGGLRPKSGGKELDGREWCDMPMRAIARGE